VLHAFKWLKVAGEDRFRVMPAYLEDRPAHSGGSGEYLSAPGSRPAESLLMLFTSFAVRYLRLDQLSYRGKKTRRVTSGEQHSLLFALKPTLWLTRRRT
jgi:hypothetical protein